MQPRGSQLMIRVYEDLNLGIYFWILGLFWGFYCDFFSDFWVFSVSDIGTSGLFFGNFGTFLGFWDFPRDFGTFFGIFFSIFFSVSDFGIFFSDFDIFLKEILRFCSDFWDFEILFGLLGFWDFFGIFLRVYEDFFEFRTSCQLVTMMNIKVLMKDIVWDNVSIK